MLTSLLWKESREHLPKLLGVSALFTLFFIAFLFYNSVGPDFSEATIGFFFATCWFLPAWMAASTVTSEKSHRTDRLLSAIPIQPWKIYTLKTTAGLLTFLLPTAAILLYLATLNFNLPSPIEWLGLFVGIASLYLLITALTLHTTRESHAVMWGFLLTIAAFLLMLLGDSIPNPSLRWYLLVLNPFAPLMLPEFNGPATTATFSYNALYIQLAIAPLWWTLGLLRYNPAPKYNPHNSGADVPVGLTSPPLPSKNLSHSHSIFRTLLWRESREQAWIILAASITGLLFAAIIAILITYNAGYSPTAKLTTIAHYFAQCTISLSLMIPAIIAVILGVSSWATDLHSKLFDFWRSRPIPPATLFWSKFLTSLLGILALMTTFALTSLACAAYAHSHGLPFNPSTDIADLADLYTTAPIALTAILAISITITLLIRRPLYAAILAFSLILLTFIATNRISGPINYPLHQIQLSLAIITALALTLSHRTLTHNWQLKPTTH